MELPTPSTASEQQTVDDIDKFGWAFLGGPAAADALTPGPGLCIHALTPRSSSAPPTAARAARR